VRAHANRQNWKQSSSLFREGLGLVRERGEAEGAEANVLKGGS